MEQHALENNMFPTFSGLTLGRVYKIYPQSNMVDILLFDGNLLTKVQVLSSYASSRSGVLNLPQPKYDEEMITRDKPFTDAKLDGESDVIAVVGFLGDSLFMPIVLGFLFPEMNEVLCSRDDVVGNQNGTMYLWKHESNVYVKVTEKGENQNTAEIEVHHPSGLRLKIGNDIESTVPTNYDNSLRPFNKYDPTTKEQQEAPYVHVVHPSGTRITVDPEGNVDEFVYGDVNREVRGTVTETYNDEVTRIYQKNVTETCREDWNRTVDGTMYDTGRPIHHNSTE